MLRARGFDVIAAAEVGGAGASDEEQFERANADGRAILTFNSGDFNRIAVRCFLERRKHAGIIVAYGQHRRRDIAALVERIARFLDGMPEGGMADNYAVLPAAE